MSIRKSFMRWSAYQKTLRELNSLGNHELSDMGINRGDIARIARDHARSL